MTITVVSSSTIQGGALGISSGALPSGMQTGDLMVAFATHSNSTGGLSFRINGQIGSPPKWTVIDTTTLDASHSGCAWRIVDGTETSWSTAFTSGSGRNGGSIICLRGTFNSASPIVNKGYNAVASGTSNTASVATEDGCFVISWADQDNSTTDITLTKDSNYTAQDNTHGSSIVDMVLSYKTPVAASSASATITNSPTAQTRHWMVSVRALPNADVAMTLAAMTQEIDVTETAGASADIAQTLPAMSQEIDVTTVPIDATVDQTFPAMTQALLAVQEETDTIAQTLPQMVQTINVTASPGGAIDQTLSGMLQELLVTQEIEVTGIDMTLPGMIQELIMVSEVENAIITQLFPLDSQEADVEVGGSLFIRQTLPGVLQEALVTQEVIIDSIDMTLSGTLEQDVEVGQSPPSFIVQTLPGGFATEFDAVEEEPSEIDMTFVAINYARPEFATIDMVLNPPCHGSSGISRSGWWPG